MYVNKKREWNKAVHCVNKKNELKQNKLVNVNKTQEWNKEVHLHEQEKWTKAN
jgi:hypothetical protein